MLNGNTQPADEARAVHAGIIAAAIDIRNQSRLDSESLVTNSTRKESTVAKKKKAASKKTSSRASDLAAKIMSGYQATVDEIKELASALVGKVKGKGKKEVKAKAKAAPAAKAAKKKKKKKAKV